MTAILHINTALDEAYVALSDGGKFISELKNPDQKSHAAFLHPAISQILTNAGIKVRDLQAVSVISGPGSYTGLRVGLAAAKGICFICNCPLIMVNTLEWMVASVKKQENLILCPMIDARRNEVFTALYNAEGIEIMPPHALILQENSFSEKLSENKILFFGNGAEKTQKFIIDKNAEFFLKNSATSREQIQISNNFFKSRQFSDLVYAEPLYVKDFYSTSTVKTPN